METHSSSETSGNAVEVVEEKIDIEDPEEARDFIRERVEKEGVWPIVTVPIEYAEAARQGIKPHTTWIFDAVIAGTLGRDPYNPGQSERLVFRVKVPLGDIMPRFTGPDKHFHGIVLFRKPIPPTMLEEVGYDA